MDTQTIAPGCIFDNHRGHYISRDVIKFAIDLGFIVGPFEQYALDTYDDDFHHDTYPAEALIELSTDAIEWLNSGTGVCGACNGSGKVYVGIGSSKQPVICKDCSGHGRGPRIAGQNFPPRVPEGHSFGYNDGDFGLYPDDDLLN